MYGYAAGLGVPGGHPGLDISMPGGSKLYIPVNGTVIYGGGSGSFRNASGDGPGMGELRIQADDGTLVILGHMLNIPWRPGQRVTVGQLAGLSGGFNGDHLHLEVRVPGQTSTGWKAIDPRTYFGNQSIAYGGSGPTGSTGSYNANVPWWEQI
jgi:murein DD-endopeptidase MepM/ murein hydrolase activator NlpD